MSGAPRVIALVPAAPQGVQGDERVVDAVLQQLAGELAILAASPAHLQIIDLRSLPLDQTGITQLVQHLGRGEVRAEVRSAACTVIEETAFAGVWWQRQQAAEGSGADAWQALVVAAVPPLLAAHSDDVADAAARLQTSLPVSGVADDHPRPTGAIA